MPKLDRVPSLVLLLLSCCAPPPAAPVEQPKDPESPAKAIPMGDHFVKSGIIRDAVIQGDLEKTKAPAQWLLDNLVADDLPVRWRPHVPRVRKAAMRILEAETIADAAAATGDMAAACGECHTDTGIELKPAARSAPLKDETTFAQMDRHGYAADRMWDGLVGPNDAAWTDGGERMRDAPLHGDAVPESVTALAIRVHDLATTAIELDAKHRGERYGEIIGTCAACHQQLSSKTARR